MAKTVNSAKAGSRVIFSQDPLLYGPMLVVEVMRVERRIKWISCLVCPDTAHRRTERFYPDIDALEIYEDSM